MHKSVRKYALKNKLNVRMRLCTFTVGERPYYELVSSKGEAIRGAWNAGARAGLAMLRSEVRRRAVTRVSL